MQRKLAELCIANGGNENLRGDVFSLETSVESYKDQINRLTVKLEGTGVGQTDCCMQLGSIEAQTGRLPETLRKSLRREDQKICSINEKDEEKPCERPAKKARRSESD
ncbi:unnamed protein product [Orchesella dallaii]|uniref:Uncharacterized protein n=1 Tax=Orchesella dallaii TaxID=48710 RepID=A0ABP1R171_9HEXA